MIKAEELMIGDWVLDGTKYAQVTSITCDGIIETTVNEKSNIELLEPIPITSEILEKNGFKKEDDDCYLWNESLERIIWFEGGYTVLTSVRCDRMYEGHCYDIHKLQQLLKLCGINKEIIA